MADQPEHYIKETVNKDSCSLDRVDGTHSAQSRCLRKLDNLISWDYQNQNNNGIFGLGMVHHIQTYFYKLAALQK